MLNFLPIMFLSVAFRNSYAHNNFKHASNFIILNKQTALLEFVTIGIPYTWAILGGGLGGTGPPAKN